MANGNYNNGNMNNCSCTHTCTCNSNSNINTGTYDNGNMSTGTYDNGNMSTGTYDNGNMSTGTYDNGNMSTGTCDNGNMSTGTYDNGNMSTSTYDNGNMSTGTYDNGNMSTSTYDNGNMSTGTWNNGNMSTGTYDNGNMSTGTYDNGNMSTGTYDNGNMSTGTCDNGNMSTGTYDNGNMSTSTYDNGNMSTGTYDNGNMSTSTYDNGNMSTGTWNNGNMSTGTWNNGNMSTGTYDNGNMSTGTYDNGNMSTGTCDNGNMSTGTYDNGNMSTGTWNNGNMSTGTWNNGNMSTGTYDNGNMSTGTWNNGNMSTGTYDNGNMSTSASSVDFEVIDRSEAELSPDVRNGIATGNYGGVQPNLVPVVFAPIVLTPAFIEVGKWLGLKIGKWALSTALKELKNRLFPSSANTVMEDALRKLQADFDQRLQQDKHNQLLAAYTGFNQLANQFISVTERIVDEENTYLMSPTEGNRQQLNESKSLARDYFFSIHSQMIVWIEQFLVPGYEPITLPLFAKMGTLHLTHLKDGILTGSTWGLSQEDITHFKAQFYDRRAYYTGRAVTVYNQGFSRIREQGGTGAAIQFRTYMTVALFDEMYLWSLLTYEGITPTLSRTLFHYIGYPSTLGPNEMKTLYKLMVGVPNSKIKHVWSYYYAHAQVAGQNWTYSGLIPTYSQGTAGLIGSQDAYVRWGYNFGSTPRRVHGLLGNQTYTRWNIKVDGTTILGYGFDSGAAFDISYSDHYIRTMAAKPNEPNIFRGFSLADTIEYPVSPRGNNVIVGFAPDLTKNFMATRVHKLERDKSYTIPATHYVYLTNPGQAYFDDEIVNGTDGRVSLYQPGNTAVYDLDVSSIDRNKEYVLLIRIAGGSSAFSVYYQREIQPITLNLSLVSGQATAGGYYDYVSAPFKFENSSSARLQVIHGSDTRGLSFNQIILIPRDQYRRQF